MMNGRPDQVMVFIPSIIDFGLTSLGTGPYCRDRGIVGDGGRASASVPGMVDEDGRVRL
jgi:hypothetical protein